MREAVRPIAAFQDGLTLHLVQKRLHLLRRKVLMVQALDEVGNGLVKVNVVFPERVVGVNEESLRNHSQKIYHGGTEARRKPRPECQEVSPNGLLPGFCILTHACYITPTPNCHPTG